MRWGGRFEKDLLVPLNAAKNIAKLPPGDASVAVDDKSLHVRAGGSLFSVKLVDATFPPIEQVIPSDNGRGIIHPDRVALASMVKKFTAFIKKPGQDAIVLRLSKNRLALSAEVESASVCDSVPVEYDGEEKKVGLSVAYLSDALRAVDSDTVCLMIADGLEPLKILSDSARFMAVIMPMRIA